MASVSDEPVCHPDGLGRISFARDLDVIWLSSRRRCFRTTAIAAADFVPARSVRRSIATRQPDTGFAIDRLVVVGAVGVWCNRFLRSPTSV